MDSPKLSIVMPALDEEERVGDAIRNTLAAFDDFGLAGEIIVVNDGSRDGTDTIVRSAMRADSRIRTIVHTEPAGIGASFWEGVDEARGEIVCMLPGDNENDPWEILRYVNLLEHVDIVIPFVFNKQVRSLFRNFLSLSYRFIINTTFLVNLNYTNGTVMYYRDLLKEIDHRSQGFFFQTDILVRAVKAGYLFAEVPYQLGQRDHGVSKAVSFPSLLRVVKGYTRLVSDVHFRAESKMEKVFAPGSQSIKRYRQEEQEQPARSHVSPGK